MTESCFQLEAVLQDRRLTFRGPGSCAAGSFGQTRFVDEDDYSALSRSDFFSSGYLLAGSMKMGLPSCLSRMRGQLACPVLRGARASNGPRLLDQRFLLVTIWVRQCDTSLSSNWTGRFGLACQLVQKVTF